MKTIKTLGSTMTLPHLHTVLQQITKALQGNISFGTSFVADNFSLSYGAGPTANIDQDINIKCFKALGTTPGTPNTTFTVTNTPQFFQDGHVPIGVIVVSVDQAGAVIQSVTIGSWTKSSISLACNVASVNYRIILI